MAFAFVAAGTAYDASSSASAVVPTPAGVAANDLLLCYLSHVGATSNSIPSGWALLGERDSAGDGKNRALFWKLAGGSEPSDYTWGYAAAGRLGGVMVAYRDGFDTADPFDVVSNTAYTTSDSIVRAASMVVSVANSPLIYIGSFGSSSAVTFTAPTSPTTFAEDHDSHGSSAREGRTFASVIWSGSGATGDIDATCTGTNGDVKHAFALALNLPAGGRTTKNTRSAPLGVSVGMQWRMPV